MSAEPVKVIMIGPSIDDPGGIASVLQSYISSDLPRLVDLVLIETARGRGLFRHLRGLVGTARAIAAAVSTPGAIVHVHMSFGGSFWRKSAVLIAAHLAGRSTMLHLHGSRFHTWAAAGALRRRMVRYVFGLSDVIVVLSQSWAERVRALSGRSDAVVLENPVGIPAHVSSGRGDRSVIFLGRIGERKGVGDLLEAITILRSRGIEARWTIAGDGAVEWAQRRVDAAGLSEVVDLPGWVDRLEVERMLRNASVFCLPSTDEGLPIALLEAMAYGLACVVTPVGGIPELVVDSVNGVLVPPRDPQALADGLERVLCDKEFAIRIGDRARVDVAGSYSLERVTERLLTIYRGLVSEPQNGGEGS